MAYKMVYTTKRWSMLSAHRGDNPLHNLLIWACPARVHIEFYKKKGRVMWLQSSRARKYRWTKVSAIVAF